MDLTRYTPSRSLRDLSGELNRLLDAPWFDRNLDFSTVETSQWVPAVDIREEPERFLVEADVPGVKPEDIEVTMENGVLSIRGERHYEKDTGGNGARRVERAHGVFYRRFALPDTADPENVKARGENGVLVIEIGKREGARSRRIPVEQ
ncbi:Hsp20/alpha crystallin family protein [Spiribacter halobius]|uniref:Heat-shock protein Hsp20 n=1 Tax=Sediminicurvatus halobius TaxID=2182432 RepID=A0A2U2N591_9GAMM|nr:Hsp20/alpha crystallin family protein [Spiribacter halobius]PWG64336.1 heat-shock protein Hsp20 [Spiribacter halobius]UEX79319.1 Hsp20/alpha crystallin family protein [Spiribacter halobius]